MHTPAATCSQHALREAVGICVRCRAPMCGECVTKIDGINHCRRCLEELVAARQAVSTRATRSRLPSWLVLMSGFALLTALSWWIIEAVMPGSGS